MTMTCIAGPGSRYYPAAQGGDGFYPAGHWVAAKQALRVEYPRPDGETPTWARHHWAFYNGVNPMQYRIPVGVQFGAPPYVYTVTAGPSGLTVGRAWGDTNYGIVTWTPSGSVTGETVTIRITDQELNTIDVTWTVSTSSSTSVFVWLSPSGNDTTGNGSFATPYLTHQKLFGLTEGALTSWPNAIVCRRGGTYSFYDQGNGFGIQLRKDRTPMALIDYPGETVTHDHGNSGGAGAFSVNGSDGSDVYFAGFTVTDGPASSANYRHFYMGGQCHRTVGFEIDAPDVWSGSSTPDDNATLFFFNGLSGGMRQHVYFRDINETNRGPGNCGGVFVAFSCQYLLAEFCTTSGSSGGTDLFPKDSCLDFDIRFCTMRRTDGQFVTGTYCQTAHGFDTDRISVSYCFIDVGTDINAGWVSNLQQASSGAGQHWFFRNTCRGPISINTDGSGQGPFLIEKNAIHCNTAVANPVTNTFNNTAPGPNTTVSDTECHGNNVIDTSTLLLTGSYRTNYLGLRGAEIA